MGFQIHLERILSKIDRMLLKQGFKEDTVHQEGFRILGELFLLTSLEINNHLKPEETLLQKQERISQSFPTILSGSLDNSFNSIYIDLFNLRTQHKQHSHQDILGSLYQNILTTSYIQDKGIVFTPLQIVDYLIAQVGFQSSIFQHEEQIIDLSCGSGLFLRRSAEKVIETAQNQNLESNYIQNYVCNNIIGFDIDPEAVFISQISLANQIISQLGKDYSLETIFEPSIYQTNSLIKNDKNDVMKIKELKNSKFKYVVGNPPYIESKIMDSETKQICLDHFPDAATGHFDIYSCFLSLGYNLLTSDGKLGYIIPNKFLSSRYARKLREKFLRENQISQIVDLSHNNVFQPAVYPIIIILDKQNPLKKQTRVTRVNDYDELVDSNFSKRLRTVEVDNFLKTKNSTIYLLENSILDMINRIFSLSSLTLGDLIRFRWAISFHKSGLRELFVSENPLGENPIKFIGGKAYGGNREINRYNINWRGYWINYDHKKAKSVENNFPNYKYFGDKKIIVCQHALRIRATIDSEGYACKDIFLIGHLKERALDLGISLEYILALLNSELYSHLYSNMYSSTEIMGKYLHYLPMYLHDLPVVMPNGMEIDFLEEQTNKRLLEQTNEFTSIDEIIDKKIYELYECNEEEIELAKTHIREYLVK
ncbi:MAG: N-6 DNA methylase [Candidatus Heimdallarchaeota archaeon]|nr:N-6 DNA methylase [Candidatus Heimdallarchaeota archaeon]